MTQLFFNFLGKYAIIIINYYRKNQDLFNLIVLFYGILMTISYRNFKRLENYLKDKMGVDDMCHFSELFENSELYKIDIKSMKKELKAPIMLLSYRFYFLPATKKTILYIFRKKCSRSANDD